MPAAAAMPAGTAIFRFGNTAVKVKIAVNTSDQRAIQPPPTPVLSELMMPKPSAAKNTMPNVAKKRIIARQIYPRTMVFVDEAALSGGQIIVRLYSGMTFFLASYSFLRRFTSFFLAFASFFAFFSAAFLMLVPDEQDNLLEEL